MPDAQEACATCGRTLMQHTKDQAVDCGKIGYWTWLCKTFDGRREAEA